MQAVVFDLFGTLVDAPTPHQRAEAASRLASVVGCDTSKVEYYFRTSWLTRHDGTLPDLASLAAHLVCAMRGPDAAMRLVAEEWRALAEERLVPAGSVIDALTSLRIAGIAVGLLSDGSAEIAAAWSTSVLASLVDVAMFSCEAGAVKPDQRLYRRMGGELRTPPNRTLYVGDGGGDELRGAVTAGMAAVAVHRRGPPGALAFGDREWRGPTLEAVEDIPGYVARHA